MTAAVVEMRRRWRDLILAALPWWHADEERARVEHTDHIVRNSEAARRTAEGIRLKYLRSAERLRR